LSFFSDRFGYRYAFPKYAQVCITDFTFGGMENTSCTLLTDRCLMDERAALDNLQFRMLVAHELAHQWFGDLLVINHWSHAWVKEGMATYSEVLWTDGNTVLTRPPTIASGKCVATYRKTRAATAAPWSPHVIGSRSNSTTSHL
jgi:aminopeptidase N